MHYLLEVFDMVVITSYYFGEPVIIKQSLQDTIKYQSVGLNECYSAVSHNYSKQQQHQW